MKEFYGSFTSHLKRGIVSPMFLVCLVLCSVLFLVFVGEYLDPSIFNTAPGLYYFLSQADNRGAAYFIMMITAFPGAKMFYEDWNSGNFKFIVLRAGRGNYAFAVLLATGITAATVIIVSYMVFSAIILTRFPVVEDNMEQLKSSAFGFPCSGLLWTGRAGLCYFLYILTRGAMAAFFAMVALFQSIIITNRYLTAISPVLIYIIYFSFNMINFLPTLLNPFVLFRNGYKLYLVLGETGDGSLFSPLAAVYPLLFSVASAVILSLIGSKLLHLKMNRSI